MTRRAYPDTEYTIRTFEPADETGVVALWRLTFPEEPAWNESHALIREKLTTQPELFFVCERDGHIVGTVIAGYDGVRGWVHKVASHPELRGAGIARALMHTAERALAARGCVKLNLQVREGNDRAVGFYDAIGYRIEPRTSMGKRLD